MEKIIREIGAHYGKEAFVRLVYTFKEPLYNIYIFRTHQNKKQTMGYCWVRNPGGDFFLPNVFFILELPWQDNKPNVSRVPPGIYPARIYKSPKFKRRVILLEDVPGRSWIEMHPMTYHWDTEGCIGVSYDLADFNRDGQPDLKSSANALDRILRLVPKKMTIQIKDCFAEAYNG